MHQNEPMVTALMDQSKCEPFDEDGILVERSVAGDSAAFQKLYEKYHPRVSAIARGILLDREEARDAVQEVFTLVYRNLSRFDGRSRFSTWLHRVAVNRCVQEARRHRVRRLFVPLGPDTDVAAPAEPTDSQDPRVGQAMGRLSPSDRAVLTLFYWDDLSLDEIGSALDCGANAAKTRLFRARERFKKHFEEADRP